MGQVWTRYGLECKDQVWARIIGAIGGSYLTWWWRQCSACSFVGLLSLVCFVCLQLVCLLCHISSFWEDTFVSFLFVCLLVCFYCQLSDCLAVCLAVYWFVCLFVSFVWISSTLKEWFFCRANSLSVVTYRQTYTLLSKKYKFLHASTRLYLR